MGGVSPTGGAAMSRPLTIRKPSADELHQLHQWLEQPLQSWQRRRAEVLLLYAADGSVSSIAQLLQVHRNTVSTDLREFARHGLSALSRPRKLGAPPRLSKQQIAAIWRLADQAPTTLGLPLGRWPLSGPFQTGIRFLPRPLPAAPWASLTSRFPLWGDNGLTTFRRCVPVEGSQLFAGGASSA